MSYILGSEGINEGLVKWTRQKLVATALYFWYVIIAKIDQRSRHRRQQQNTIKENFKNFF